MSEHASPEIHTQCPHCNTLFQITEEQLNALNGKVRCGYCYRVFNAQETLINELSSNAPRQQQTETQIQVNLSQPDTQALETISLAKDELKADARQQLDQTTPTTDKPFSTSNLMWSLAIAFTVIVFIGQYTYFYRDELSQRHVQLRPMLNTYCEYLNCQLAPIKALDQLKLVSHDMRIHPEQENALRVQGQFVNKADFAQPYPLITLKLTDLGGKTIAQRTFNANQYLSNKIFSIEKGIPPDKGFDAQLNITDLGSQVVGFSLMAQ